jgi:hypothetical protein
MSRGRRFESARRLSNRLTYATYAASLCTLCSPDGVVIVRTYLRCEGDDMVRGPFGIQAVLPAGSLLPFFILYPKVMFVAW